MTKITLDKTDRKILSILQADGRLSNQDVAELVNLSPSPCLRRIKRLEEAGVIRQYGAARSRQDRPRPARLRQRAAGKAQRRIGAQQRARAGRGAAGGVAARRFRRLGRAVAGGGGLLRDDRRNGLPAARARRGHGPLLALHDGDAAAPSGGAGCEVQLRAAARQGHDGAAAGVKKAPRNGTPCAAWPAAYCRLSPSLSSASAIGMNNAMPTASVLFLTVMAITPPSASTSGPPLLPGLTATSLWM